MAFRGTINSLIWNKASDRSWDPQAGLSFSEPWRLEASVHTTQTKKIGRTRLQRLLSDLTLGRLDVAEVHWAGVGKLKHFNSMMVRGVTRQVAFFDKGGNQQVGITQTNSNAKIKYTTSHPTLLIKPRIGEREATFTLAGAILGLTVPNYMHCHDIFMDGEAVEPQPQLMVVVLQKVPYSLRSWVEQSSQAQTVHPHFMLVTAVSVSCQCLISLYAFAAFSNMRMTDRHANNVMVTETSSENIDYTDSGLFLNTRCQLPSMPITPLSGGYGRLVMIDYGMLTGPVSDRSHLQSNLEQMTSRGASCKRVRPVNHFDHPRADLRVLIQIFEDCERLCDFFLNGFPETYKSVARMLLPIFKRVIERVRADVFQSGKTAGKPIDHRFIVVEALQKLLSIIPGEHDWRVNVATHTSGRSRSVNSKASYRK